MSALKHPRRGARGVTLTELLVVLVIISLLATIAIPVYVSKSNQARVATAQRECREIANALETCAITHGFFVPIHILDDLPPNASTSVTSIPDDDLANSAQAPVYLIDPNTNIQDQVGNQPQLSNFNTDSRVNRLYYNWAGPFMNFHRFYSPTVANPTDASVRRDFPLDPWGQPYRFYSPIGLIGDGADVINQSSWNSDSVFNGNLTSTDDRFDRFAVVSYGPDSETGTANLPGDDIMYKFAGQFNESSYRALLY